MSKAWEYESLEELCREDINFCAGMMIAMKITRGKLGDCPCTELIELLARNPTDYQLGVLVGLACRRAMKGKGKCELPKAEQCNDVLPEVRKKAQEVEQKLKRAGGRIVQVVCESDLVHITADYGCGKTVITVYADGYEVSMTDGVRLNEDFEAFCTKAPPYMPAWIEEVKKVAESDG